METLADSYRRDRTVGQDVSIYVGVEKAGMVIQLQSWFGDLGIPILALGGYSSETYVQQVAATSANSNAVTWPGTSSSSARAWCAGGRQYSHGDLPSCCTRVTLILRART